MASTASPYGLRAVNEIGGLPYAGSTRTFLIDPAGTAANIYNGSPVYVNANGYLAVATATGADATTNGFPVGTSNTGSSVCSLAARLLTLKVSKSSLSTTPLAQLV